MRRFVRFGPKGAERPGIMDAQGRIFALEASPDLEALPDPGLEDLEQVPGTPRLGSPIPRPWKMVCIGLNYRDHAAETGAEIPKEPIIFQKASSAIIGPNDPIYRPRGSISLDYEVELGVVIGREGSYISEKEALHHVCGYLIAHDVSERDFQKKRGGNWTKGKSADGFGPLGPWLVPAEEIPDPQALALESRVNGKLMQSGSTADMIFSVAELISYISQFMRLEVGDVIATGTPAGVGAGKTPPEFLVPGDVVELRIDSLGAQRQEVLQA